MTLAPAPPLSRLLDLSAQLLQAVRTGRSATDWMAQCPPDARAGVQALGFDALRRLGAATELRKLLAPKPPPPQVDALLCTALALLWPQAQPPYPDHTLVDQAVNAARQRTPAAAGFINAVLRRFVRDRTALVEAAERTPLGAWNHPGWWVERVRQDWPTHWQAVLRAANQRPPMTLRVNVRRDTGSAYVQRLAALGRAATLLDDPALAGQAVVLDQPCPVQQLPGFAEGEVSVQDAAAQRAAGLVLGSGEQALPAGARVLDACAAPGGKTAHLLERAELDLLALDSDPQRLARVAETLGRLQLKAELRAADARQPAGWWDGRPFDAILLDAPCTASGIVRRHPDIRWLRRPEDLLALARVQSELLQALWPLLRPGGRLVYATCSVFKAEGAQQIDAFLQRLPAGAARSDPTAPGHLLPVADNSATPSVRGAAAQQDGFFYACLHRH
ncbi:16S rRNA (cytosine(967)-C(5))-methyltransferase RsmB [Pseudorhodoferax sp.]|uniref:16S rRNA (cytosine(967)-C(5))-methyltransferase RsmB n=1 Tax=Pseudorhodoferax sp. TaxID=1993553 RepID=UPI002DD698CD|nr:16S rRNA (cytosine(967)-C(5))-methyltransferase RsmB [Pseudorhodoferax sp.]